MAIINDVGFTDDVVSWSINQVCLLLERQTPLSKNDKTVIRRATDVDAKLGNQYSADGNGDAPYNVPDPVKIKRHRCHLTQANGRGGFSTAYDNNVCPFGERRLCPTGQDRSPPGRTLSSGRARGSLVSTELLGQHPCQETNLNPVLTASFPTTSIPRTQRSPPAGQPPGRLAVIDGLRAKAA